MEVYMDMFDAAIKDWIDDGTQIMASKQDEGVKVVLACDLILDDYAREVGKKYRVIRAFEAFGKVHVSVDLDTRELNKAIQHVMNMANLR
jgi:hypothetical protein